MFDGNRGSVTAVLRDPDGNVLKGLYLSEESLVQVSANQYESVSAAQPEFFADEDGYLTKIIGYVLEYYLSLVLFFDHNQKTYKMLTLLTGLLNALPVFQ